MVWGICLEVTIHNEEDEFVFRFGAKYSTYIGAWWWYFDVWQICTGFIPQL